MEIFLAVLAVICVVVGVVGCIVPMLPGPPIAFAGLMLAQWSGYAQFTTEFLVTWGVITLAVTIADYYLPIWFTKKLGGSKMGTRGATVGMIAGLFFMPVGLVVGPFLGALIGEFINNREDGTKAFRVAMGSFVAFISGTGLKLAASGVMAFFVIKGIFF